MYNKEGLKEKGGIILIKHVIAGIVITTTLGLGGAVLTHGAAYNVSGQHTFNTKTLKAENPKASVLPIQYTPEGGTWNYGTTSTDLYSYYYNNDIHDSSTYNPIFGLVQSGTAYSGQTSQANEHVDQFGGNQSYYNDIN